MIKDSQALHCLPAASRRPRPALAPLLLALVFLSGISASAETHGGRALRETQVVRVVRAVKRSVVYVSCRQRVQNPFAGSIWDLFGSDFGPPGGQVENSLGSGVIVDSRGYVLTNEHVILNGSEIRITLSTGKRFAAKVVGTAPEMDLALLKIEGKGPFPAAALGRSDDLMIGETVIAVGNPFGLSNTVSVGVLSAKGRTVASGKKTYSDFLQTDAPINPGNSGGPLLNILGQVIGINTAIIRRAQGIGFAIPIDRARKVMAQLRTFGAVRPAWLGFLPLDPSERYKARAGVDQGFLVAKTYPYAYPQDGVQEGDLITAMNGKPMKDTGDFNTRMAALSRGARVSLSGRRGPKAFHTTLTVRLMPASLTPAMVWTLLGLKVAHMGRGIVVDAVRRGSPAEAAGVERGDLLLAVDDHPVAAEQAFFKRCSAALASTGLLLSVKRGPWTYYVTLNLLGS